MSELLYADRARLNSFIVQKQMIENRKATEAMQPTSARFDSLFVQISRDEYELLVDLAIECLRSRLEGI